MRLLFVFMLIVRSAARPAPVPTVRADALLVGGYSQRLLRPPTQ
jgi:hypothetical protein